MLRSEFIDGGIRVRKNPLPSGKSKWETNIHFHYVSPLALLFRICLLTFCSIPAFFPCRTQSSSSTQSLQPPPPPPPAQPMVGAADDRHHGGPHTIMSARAGGAQGDESAEKDEDDRLER
jgi:hypothetical protein